MRVQRSSAARYLGLIGACAIAASLQLVVAADSSAPIETIEVRGSLAEMRKQVLTFVAEVTRKDGVLIGRWDDRICPMIAGVSDEQVAFIRHRLLETEAEARRRALDETRSCQPNLFVIITTEPEKVVEDWKARDPRMFRWKSPEVIPNSTGKGPVLTWHNAVEVATGTGGSRVEGKYSEFIKNVVVLVDATRTSGKSLAQVADYIALVSLTRIDTSADPHVTQSILQLFASTSDTTAPATLTDWDRAFLHALYRTSYTPAHQRADLMARMSRELAPRTRLNATSQSPVEPVASVATNDSTEVKTASVDGPPAASASINLPAAATRGIDPSLVTERSSNPTETVVVQGSRAEMRKQVEAFVAKVTRTDGDLIGRWRDSLCPLVAGLSDEQDAFIRNRLLEVEAKVRKRAAQPDRKCQANVFVIITDDADGVVADWKEHDSKMFLWKSREDLLHSAQAGPVRIWHNAVVLRSDDGPWVYQKIGAAHAVKQGRLKDSRIVASVKEAISAVVVLIDSKKIGKVTLAQTADYLAMVSLSQIDLGADVGGTNTILKLFVDAQTGTAPAALTEWDYAFLNALYRVGYYSPMHQRMDLSARMSRELAPRK